MQSSRVTAVVACLVALCVVGTVAAGSVPYNPERALALAYHASAAYCTEDSVLNWECDICGKLPGFNVTAYLYNSQFDVAGYVGYYVGTPLVAVVAFRGTMPLSLQDWIDDLYAFHTKEPWIHSCDGCEVHAGFLDSYKTLAPQILSALAYIQPDQVHVTGHSLGAALGVLAAADLLANNYNVVSMYNFGDPRVGNPEFAAAFGADLGPDEAYRVVHYKDIVPHLPPELLGFHHIATEVWYQEDNVQYQVCNGSGEDPNCSDSIVLPWSIDDHLHYMGFPITKSCGSCCDDDGNAEPHHAVGDIIGSLRATTSA